jgi:hypothetical protein
VPGNPYYRSTHWRELRAARLSLDRNRCAVNGCGARAVVVDHVETRPASLPIPCGADRLDNLRSLCLSHDAQVKEFRGKRKQGGAFRLKGCDANGWPIDPARR